MVKNFHLNIGVEKMQLGWVGTGVLGSAVIKRLSLNYKVNTWNRTEKKLDKLTSYGIIKYNKLADLAKNSNIVFLCLAGENAHREVIFSSEGLASNLQQGSIIIDLSTIDPSQSKTIHSILLNDYSIDYIECPVSGGPENAVNGKLAAIVAGDEMIFNKVKDVLSHIASVVNFVGEVGNAQTIKILNNLAESLNLLTASEVLSMGRKLGIDYQTLKDVLSTTRGYSVYMGVLLDRLCNPTEEVSASLEVRLKDIELAHKLSTETNQWIPLGSLAKELYRLSIIQNGKHRDQTSCFNIYNNGETEDI